MYTFIGLLALILVAAPQLVRLLGWGLQALLLVVIGACHATVWLLGRLVALLELRRQR